MGVLNSSLSRTLKKQNDFRPGSVPRQSNEPAYQRSETLRLIKEEEGKPRGNLSDHPNPQGLPTCFICNRPIL
ncbi:hypothetical protein GCK32_017509 [Trichostrongylus colubriformis]|uniref:Uncharacterized protein n=1 Tax=Trichostrongylus colubriformis TaxID=6319 RepID=A0AAN8G9I0_TRICO